MITGFSKKNLFNAKNAQAIGNAFESGEYASYVILAQPVKLHSAPFCLAIFGTNNKFSAETVSKKVGTYNKWTEWSRNSCLGWYLLYKTFSLNFYSNKYSLFL